jgi:hypothetical protein
MSYNRFLFYDSGFQQLSLSAINSENPNPNPNPRSKSPFLMGENTNKEENFLNCKAQEMVGANNKIMTGLNLQQSI